MISRTLVYGLVVILCLLGTSSTTARGEDWPQWRGPRGNSISNDRGFLEKWNAQSGVLWRTELPEWGDSSPVVCGEAIFVTSQKDDELLLIKLDKKTGQIQWTQTVGRGTVNRIPLAAKSPQQRKSQNFHASQNLASPTPATDGKTVAVHFGNGETAAYDFAGHQLWHHNFQEDYGAYTVWWGHANSPALFKGMLISACMQDSLAGVSETLSPSYLVAHDLTTGKEIWKTSRMTGAKAEENDAYTTAAFVERDGQWQMLVMGGNTLDAYDPLTGKQLWYLPGVTGGRTVGGPTIAEDMVYVVQGKKGPLLAVKLGGKGEKPRTDIVWREEQGTPDSCCLLASDKWLFALNDDGIAKCFDRANGQLQWKERLKGDYKASPILADARLYCVNTKGICTVLTAGPQFEKLSENAMEEEMLASPAASDGRLYFRGRKSLICVGK